MEPVPVMAGLPGVLTLGGRSFSILPPAPVDMLRVGERMAELANAKCLSPIDYAATHTHLPPAVFALMMSEAIKLGSGGGVKPTPEAVWDEYTTLEGVRFRVWYHAARAMPDLAPEVVAELVTADNRFNVSDALDKALKLGTSDPKGPANETGTAGS